MRVRVCGVYRVLCLHTYVAAVCVFVAMNPNTVIVCIAHLAGLWLGRYTAHERFTADAARDRPGFKQDQSIIVV